ncbi:MAG: mechanosensitive ion channel family protein [Planctomycetes bacterium]|nr:mechanosensitive ion channel family protein [Planctomycetota bacterium]
MIGALQIQALWMTKWLYNEVWKWAALLGLLLLAFIAGKIVSFLLDRYGRRVEDAGRGRTVLIVLHAIGRPIPLALLAVALYTAQAMLVLDVDEAGVADVNGPIRLYWLQICKAMLALAIAWALYRLVDVVEVLLGKATSRTDTKLDDQLVPLLRKTVRVFVVILAALFIAQNIFKLEVGALLAGLGLGGLAFALAAKDSIANLFGSAVILADRPFALGDRIQVQKYDGTVEEVGFRSTKLRTLTGHYVTIPNAVLVNDTVENISRRPYLRRTLNIALTYNTPPDRMERAMEILHEMLSARAQHFHAEFPYRVCFTDFNADNLNLLVMYWFVPVDWWQFQYFNNDFNLELLRRFNDEGIEFALPTQTLYLKPQGKFTVGAPPASSGGGRAFT